MKSGNGNVLAEQIEKRSARLMTADSALVALVAWDVRVAWDVPVVWDLSLVTCNL